MIYKKNYLVCYFAKFQFSYSVYLEHFCADLSDLSYTEYLVITECVHPFWSDMFFNVFVSLFIYFGSDL